VNLKQTTATSTASDVASAADQIRLLLRTDLLTRGRIVVIGLGGIGLHLVRALTTFLAGLLTSLDESHSIEVLLVDGDSFTPENCYRMDVPDFGKKAEAVGRDLLGRMESPRLLVRWESVYVDDKNVSELIRDGDCVFLACDNHATRRLVGRHCAGDSIVDVVLISGGNDGVENGSRGTYGNVQLFLRCKGINLTAPIERFHPEIANPADQPPGELSCLELAGSGVPQLGFANLTAASAMCNSLMRLMMAEEGEAIYDELAFDVFEAVCTPHWLTGGCHAE
jgi:molybdopterin/thiamine biosynthesis adenylyltransferase